MLFSYTGTIDYLCTHEIDRYGAGCSDEREIQLNHIVRNGRMSTGWKTRANMLRPRDLREFFYPDQIQEILQTPHLRVQDRREIIEVANQLMIEPNDPKSRFKLTHDDNYLSRKPNLQRKVKVWTFRKYLN